MELAVAIDTEWGVKGDIAGGTWCAADRRTAVGSRGAAPESKLGTGGETHGAGDAHGVPAIGDNTCALLRRPGGSGWTGAT
jgi:hypothetical protein